MMVNNCMSCISNNEEKFKKVVGPYKETLDRQTGRQAGRLGLSEIKFTHSCENFLF